jgi:tRNA(adenine34) deaminase
MKLPDYILEKSVHINLTKFQIKSLGYLQSFALLKAEFPSISYMVLKELYQYCTGDIDLEHNNLNHLIAEYSNSPPVFPSIANMQHQHFMNSAYKEAQIAEKIEEIPIGSVIVNNSEVIARAYNMTNKNCDIMAHAEIIAIQQANKYKANYRLNDCDLYVTLEPCIMCAGAIIESRIKRLIFGSYRSNGMGAVSRGLFAQKKYNPHCQVIYFEDQSCTDILTESFVKLRKKS